MLFFDRRTLAVLTTALLVAAVLWLTWAARRTLLAFLFAVFFAYLLEPAVEWIQQRTGGSRLRAIAVTYAALLLIVGATVVFAVPRLVAEGAGVVHTLPQVTADVNTGQIAQTIGRQHGWSYETRAAIQRWIGAHRQDISGAAQDVAGRAAELSANAAWILLIPILSLFFLKDKSCFGDAVLSLVPDKRRRAFWRSVIDDLDRMLAQYIRAQLLLCGASIVAYTAFLGVMRFPYALGLGVMAGMLEFIPFVGPAITAVLLFAIGFFGGYPHWAIILGFVGVWRILQDYVNAPYIMGEGLELHPLAAIFGVLVGGEVAGIAGMFLSIPVIAALRIVWRNWNSKELEDAQELKDAKEILRAIP